MAFEQRSEGWEGHIIVFQAEGTTCAKVLGQDYAWCVGGTVRRPMSLEQSEGGAAEREGGPEGTEEMEAGHAGPCGPWGRLGLFPQGR